MIFKNALYFYFSYIFFLVSGSFINFFIFVYSLLGMDNISWGKTRQVAKDATILYIDESTDYIYDEEYIREIIRETEV